MVIHSQFQLEPIQFGMMPFSAMSCVNCQLVPVMILKVLLPPDEEESGDRHEDAKQYDGDAAGGHFSTDLTAAKGLTDLT